MIYIFDNGKAYSSHSIYFIESAWPDPAAVEGLINAYGRQDEPGAGVVAVTERLDWREGDNLPLQQFFQPHEFFTEVLPDEPAPLFVVKRRWGEERYQKNAAMWRACPADLLRHLVEEWPKSRIVPISEEPLAWFIANVGAAS